MRRPLARRDDNHEALTKAFETLGCTVLDAHASGIPGQPDVIVGCMGSNHLVEYKNLKTAYGRSGLSQSQADFARHWNGGPVYVVTCADDVVELVHLWRVRTGKVML